MKFSEFISESDSGTVKYAYNELCNSDIIAKIKKASPKPSQVDLENEKTHVVITIYPKDGSIPDLSKIEPRVKSLVNQILKREHLTPRFEFSDDIKIYV